MPNKLTGTAAQSIGDVAESVYDKVKGAVDTVSSAMDKFHLPGTSAPKPDTSWHDQMVKEANASFAKPKSTTTHQAGHQRTMKKYGK